MAKKPKPTVEVFIDCPHCGSELRVSVYKRRLDKPSPPEYAITADVRVETQGTLFDEGDANAAKVSVE